MRYRHFHYKGTLKTGTLKGILNMEKLFVDLGKKSYDILFSDSFNGFAKAMSDINAPKKLLVVTDSNVEKHRLPNEVNDLLIKTGYEFKNNTHLRQVKKTRVWIQYSAYAVRVSNTKWTEKV